jgi:putative FmdB family regulatory protein
LPAPTTTVLRIDMPTYEYKCEKCGTVFEKRQLFADAPLSTHPECGGPVHRLMSAPAFQLKGTGWYATDYAKSGATSPPASHGNGDKNEGSSSESSKNDGKGDGKTDSGESKKTESAAPASTSTTTTAETKSS